MTVNREMKKRVRAFAKAFGTNYTTAFRAVQKADADLGVPEQSDRVYVPDSDLPVFARFPAVSPAECWDTMLLGVGETRSIIWDVANCPHLLMVGAPGTGKSEVLRSLMLQAVEHDHSWQVTVFDPKGEQFAGMDVEPSVERVTDAAAFLARLVEIEMMMLIRYRQMQAEQVTHWTDLAAAQQTGEAGEGAVPSLRAMLVAVDELAALEQMAAGADSDVVERARRALEQIGRLGRAAGIHLVLAAQVVDGSWLSPAALENVDARLLLGPMDRSVQQWLGASADVDAGIAGRGVFRDHHGLWSLQVYLAE